MDAVNFNLTSDIDDDHFPLSDDEFWTPEQLVLLNSFSPAVHVFFGIFLSFICLMGIGANALVLLTFIRFVPAIIRQCADIPYSGTCFENE